MYMGLFGSRENVDVLNEVSGLGFSLIQRSLQTRMIVAICALTDQPKTRSQHNLTVFHLLERLADEFETDIDSIKGKLDDAIKRLRTYRHKMLVHLDKKVALGEMKIESVMTDDLDQSLDAIYDTMNYICLKIEGTQSVYEFTSIGPAASAIVWAAKDTRRLAELRELVSRNQVTASQLIDMVRSRSSRRDSRILDSRND